MPIQRLSPDTMPKIPGLHQTVRVGNTVYISGQVALDQQGNIVGKGDAEAQVQQIYKNLESACRAYGCTLADIVKTTTYITDIAYASAVRKGREGVYGPNPPTSTLVVVSALARPEFVVEIEAIAWIE